MQVTITDEQARTLAELWGEPIGTNIDVRWIEFPEANAIAVNINGRSIRYDTTDIDPDRNDVIDAIQHIIAVLTKNIGEAPPPTPIDPQRARELERTRAAARAKADEARKKALEHQAQKPPPKGSIANPHFDKSKPPGPNNIQFIRDPKAPPPAGLMLNPKFDQNKPIGQGNFRFIADPNAPPPTQPPTGFVVNPRFDARKPVGPDNRRFTRDPNAPPMRDDGPPPGFVANPAFNTKEAASSNNPRWVRSTPPPAPTPERPRRTR